MKQSWTKNGFCTLSIQRKRMKEVIPSAVRALDGRDRVKTAATGGFNTLYMTNTAMAPLFYASIGRQKMEQHPQSTSVSSTMHCFGTISVTGLAPNSISLHVIRVPSSDPRDCASHCLPACETAPDVLTSRCQEDLVISRSESWRSS